MTDPEPFAAIAHEKAADFGIGIRAIVLRDNALDVYVEPDEADVRFKFWDALVETVVASGHPCADFSIMVHVVGESRESNA